MTATVKVLPTFDKVEQVLELHGYGWAEGDIAEKVFGRTVDGAGIKTVRQIIADPHLFDSDIDEVAVARALQGDRPVWDALTHYERRAVMLKIVERRENEIHENYVDRSAFKGAQWTKQKGWQYKAPHEVTPEWIRILADMIGWQPRRVVQEAKAYAEAKVL